MSAKVMGKVWDLDLPHNQMLVLLAMGDHADHDGNNVFPSIGLIAWKTGYSDKQVRRIQKELIKTGILIEVSKQSGKPIRYSIDTSKGTSKPPYDPGQNVHSDKMSPRTFETPNPSQNVQTTLDMPSAKNDIEPSLNRQEPSVVSATSKTTKNGKHELIDAWVKAMRFDGEGLGCNYYSDNRLRTAAKLLKWSKPPTVDEITQYCESRRSATPTYEFNWLENDLPKYRAELAKPKNEVESIDPATWRDDYLAEFLNRGKQLGHAHG